VTGMLAALLWLGQAAPSPPELVSALGKSLFAEPDAKGVVAKADTALAADPENLELLLAAARARDELWRFRESIEMYTRGLARAPNDFRWRRFRGHRYISTRRFDLAAEDLEKARALEPSSFDVAYHLGLAYYLLGKFDPAAEEYGRCLSQSAGGETGPKLPEGFRSCADSAREDNSRVALVEWRYRALGRAGRREDAARLLDGISEGMKVTTNDIYYRSLLYYKGARSEARILEGLTGNQFSTVGYAVANRHWLEGRRAEACKWFHRVVEEKTWSAFGYIASETELARGACR